MTAASNSDARKRLAERTAEPADAVEAAAVALMRAWGCGPGDMEGEHTLCRSKAHERAYWGVRCGFVGNAVGLVLLATPAPSHEAALSEAVEALADRFAAFQEQARSHVQGKRPVDKMAGREACVWDVAEYEVRALLARHVTASRRQA